MEVLGMNQEEIKTPRESEDNTLSIDEELQQMIVKLANFMMKNEITFNTVKSKLTDEIHRIKESFIIIEEETQDEKEFRKKVETFFAEGSEPFRYLDEKVAYYRGWTPETRAYEIANAVEILCAAYKLYKQGKRLRQHEIYVISKDRMPESIGKGSKQNHVYKYTSKVFPFIRENVEIC